MMTSIHWISPNDISSCNMDIKHQNSYTIVISNWPICFWMIYLDTFMFFMIVRSRNYINIFHTFVILWSCLRVFRHWTWVFRVFVFVLSWYRSFAFCQRWLTGYNPIGTTKNNIYILPPPFLIFQSNSK